MDGNAGGKINSKRNVAKEGSGDDGMSVERVHVQAFFGATSSKQAVTIYK